MTRSDYVAVVLAVGGITLLGLGTWWGLVPVLAACALLLGQVVTSRPMRDGDDQ